MTALITNQVIDYRTYATQAAAQNVIDADYELDPYDPDPQHVVQLDNGRYAVAIYDGEDDSFVGYRP